MTVSLSMLSSAISIGNGRSQTRRRPGGQRLSRMVLIALIGCVPASTSLLAQGAKAGSDWSRVQALPAGTMLAIKARGSHHRCKLLGVGPDAITCSRNGSSPLVVAQADVRSIKIVRRGRSALIGTAIGGGTGAIVGFATFTNNQSGFFGPNFLRGPATGVLAVLGGGAGAGIGALTDFSGSTVYRAP